MCETSKRNKLHVQLHVFLLEKPHMKAKRLSWKGERFQVGDGCNLRHTRPESICFATRYGGKSHRQVVIGDNSLSTVYLEISEHSQYHTGCKVAATGGTQRRADGSHGFEFFIRIFKKYIYWLIWLCWVLVVALENFSCSVWGLVPYSGIEHRPHALEAWSLSHRTTREVPFIRVFKTFKIFLEGE